MFDKMKQNKKYMIRISMILFFSLLINIILKDYVYATNKIESNDDQVVKTHFCEEDTINYIDPTNLISTLSLEELEANSYLRRDKTMEGVRMLLRQCIN